MWLMKTVAEQHKRWRSSKIRLITVCLDFKIAFVRDFFGENSLCKRKTCLDNCSFLKFSECCVNGNNLLVITISSRKFSTQETFLRKHANQRTFTNLFLHFSTLTRPNTTVQERQNAWTFPHASLDRARHLGCYKEKARKNKEKKTFLWSRICH